MLSFNLSFYRNLLSLTIRDGLDVLRPLCGVPPEKCDPEHALRVLNDLLNTQNESHQVPGVGRKDERTQLPGAAWCVVPFFSGSSANAEVRLKNFREFSKRIRAQGVLLLGVEQVDSGHRGVLSRNCCDEVIRVEGCGSLWQKEALINIGVKNLPDACDKVYWSDGDVMLWDNDWLRKSNLLLEKHKLVQPFSFALNLAKPRRIRFLPSHFATIKPSYVSLAKMFRQEPFLVDLSPPFGKASSGYLWGARRSLLQNLPLYPRAIVGGGDSLFAMSLRSGSKASLFTSRPRYFGNGALRYADELFTMVNGSFAYLDGLLTHLYHADHRHRGYLERLQIFDLEDFDPDRDLCILENGLVAWSTERKKIQEAIREYRYRREMY